MSSGGSSDPPLQRQPNKKQSSAFSSTISALSGYMPPIFGGSFLGGGSNNQKQDKHGNALPYSHHGIVTDDDTSSHLGEEEVAYYATTLAEDISSPSPFVHNTSHNNFYNNDSLESHNHAGYSSNNTQNMSFRYDSPMIIPEEDEDEELDLDTFQHQDMLLQDVPSSFAAPSPQLYSPSPLTEYSDRPSSASSSFATASPFQPMSPIPMLEEEKNEDTLFRSMGHQNTNSTTSPFNSFVPVAPAPQSQSFHYNNSSNNWSATTPPPPPPSSPYAFNSDKSKSGYTRRALESPSTTMTAPTAVETPTSSVSTVDASMFGSTKSNQRHSKQQHPHQLRAAMATNVLSPPLYRPTHNRNSPRPKTPSSQGGRPKTPSQGGRPKTPSQGGRPKTPNSKGERPKTPSSQKGRKTPDDFKPHRKLPPFSTFSKKVCASSSTRSSTRIKGSIRNVQRQFNFEDDIVKKTRIKTELCLHYKAGRVCPFGSKCTFAHGEEELQMTRLMDLHDAGLVDVETYRTKPCFTWVMCGSCPFGHRCTSIHDPRIKGGHASWLTHTETQGNDISTDINVDCLFQKFQHRIHHNTPFGDQLSLDHDGWADLYRRVCNLESSASSSPDSWTRGSVGGNGRSVHPICKLKIAIIMRGKNADFQFKYQPTHLLDRNACMVLQKRAFTVNAEGEEAVNCKKNKRRRRTSNKNKNSDDATNFTVEEIPLENRTNKDVLVYELAFGPDSDPVSRPVALWFNIKEEDMIECDKGEAKSFRWKRGIRDGQNNPEEEHDGQNKPAEEHDEQHLTEQIPSLKDSKNLFSSLESFVMIRPHDKDAYDLTSAILEHRVASLIKERIPNLKERFEALQELEDTKKVLQTRFECLVKHWVSWAWPINLGREHVTKKTPVPPIDSKYTLPPPPPLAGAGSLDSDSFNTTEIEVQTYEGCQIHRVWKSFVDQTNVLAAGSDDEAEELTTASSYQANQRLSVFRDLQEGIELASDRSLPHIRSTSYQKQGKPKNSSTDDGPAMKLLENRPSRCWKSLLLKSKKAQEWAVVLDHFLFKEAVWKERYGELAELMGKPSGSLDGLDYCNVQLFKWLQAQHKMFKELKKGKNTWIDTGDYERPICLTQERIQKLEQIGVDLEVWGSAATLESHE